MEAAQTRTKFTLTVNRQKGEVETDSKIDRYVIELKKSNEDESFGITPTIDQDCVCILDEFIPKNSLRNFETERN